MIYSSPRDIYDNICTMLNVVITDAQREAIYQSTMREFFSYVKPIVTLSNVRVEELEANGVKIERGYKDVNNTLGLDIGEYSIASVDKLSDQTFIRTQPIDYAGDYKMEDTYAGAFQMVAEHFFKKVEKDNYGMLQSGGISMEEHIEVEDINQLRDYLRKEFGIIVGSTVI